MSADIALKSSLSGATYFFSGDRKLGLVHEMTFMAISSTANGLTAGATAPGRRMPGGKTWTEKQARLALRLLTSHV
jgi:hypothetical protein